MPPYGLYQTLIENEGSYEADISKENKKTLVKFLNKVEPAYGEAILMLICEHAKLNDRFEYDPVNLKLPYKGIQKDFDVIFELKNLPVSLRHILYKFSFHISQQCEN
ncbi:hypothetical protein OAG24_00985 [bacterium]|nr:hypothetical protein [bacterium]